MLQANIYIELPGEEVTRPTTRWERIQSKLGAKIDMGTGVKRLTLNPLETWQALCTGLGTAHLTDAVWLIVNDKVLYLDEEGRPQDLDHAWVAESPLGSADFRELHLALTHEALGVEAMVLVDIRTPVPVGTEEMRVRVSARISNLRIRPGESAADYVQRVRAFAAKKPIIEAHRVQIREFARSLGQCLADAFGDATFRLDEARVRVQRLQLEQFAHFRELSFGDQFSQRVYRPAPKVARHAVYDDPFVYLWWDPYADLLHWVLLDAMVHRVAWRSEHVEVVDPGGTLVCRGDQVPEHAQVLEPVVELAYLDEHGKLAVSRSVPQPTFTGDPISGHSEGRARRPRGR
ncbi:MAG: hypothetical protein JRJ84_20435 [Deltaproteobacteria bacterium]|nr:hypothetical protein [Deltaproteobacteria bacterium]